MSRTSNKRYRVSGSGCLLRIVILLVVLALLAAGGFFMMQRPVDPSDEETVAVKIEPGSGTAVIASQLKEADLVRSGMVFRLYSKISGDETKYQAGTYRLSRSMSVSKIAGILSGGETSDQSVTIPEGKTVPATAAALEQAGVVNAEEFEMQASSKVYKEDYPFLKDAEDGSEMLEGYLFPDTYPIPENADADQIIRLMLDRYAEVYTDEYHARAEELGLSDYEVLTIASIIEMESGNVEDRPKVASVIYNRLEINMPLQMDSTIMYALMRNGKDTAHHTSYEDLKEESPYNTYLNYGLPPGPICCPGASSIEAALYPADTDYLYFVLSDKLDGSSVFTNNYEDFLKASDAYGDASDAEEAARKAAEVTPETADAQEGTQEDAE